MTEAIGLPERARFTLLHCDAPMQWRGNTTSWAGPPGAGTETTEARYVCACGARATVQLTEPA